MENPNLATCSAGYDPTLYLPHKQGNNDTYKSDLETRSWGAPHIISPITIVPKISRGEEGRERWACCTCPHFAPILLMDVYNSSLRSDGWNSKWDQRTAWPPLLTLESNPTSSKPWYGRGGSVNFSICVLNQPWIALLVLSSKHFQLILQ